MPTFRERLEGGLYGLLIGDALGVPYVGDLPETLATSWSLKAKELDEHALRIDSF